MIYNETLDVIPLNVYEKLCSSCRLYIRLFVTFLVISIVIGADLVYFYWRLKKKDDVGRVKYNHGATHILIN